MPPKKKFLAYNRGVTDVDLWRTVGQLLEQARKDKGWAFQTDVYANGGPHYAIVKRHEQGKISTLSALDKHAKALNIDMTDLIRSALDKSKTRLTPRGRQIGRLFDALKTERKKAAVETLIDSLGEAASGSKPDPGSSG